MFGPLAFLAFDDEELLSRAVVQPFDLACCERNVEDGYVIDIGIQVPRATRPSAMQENAPSQKTNAIKHGHLFGR